MKPDRYYSQLNELRKLMRFQLTGIFLAILFGTVAYGIQSGSWLNAFTIGTILLGSAIIGAPLVYSRAKHQLRLLNNRGREL